MTSIVHLIFGPYPPLTFTTWLAACFWVVFSSDSIKNSIKNSLNRLVLRRFFRLVLFLQLLLMLNVFADAMTWLSDNSAYYLIVYAVISLVLIYLLCSPLDNLQIRLWELRARREAPAVEQR